MKREIETIDDFPEEQGTNVTIDGIEFAVFNLDGELYGINNLCPHKNLPLSPAGSERIVSTPDDTVRSPCTDRKGIGRMDVDNRTVSYPWHGL